MSRFKTVTLLFAGLLFLMLATSLWIPIHLFFYAFPILLYIAIVAWGVASINAGFFMPVICKGDSSRKHIAITFDDGPAAYTHDILNTLKSYNVKAAFFCTGHNIDRHPEMLKRIDAEGHIIGGHSFSHHFWFDLFTSPKMYQELKRTADLIEMLTGKRTKLFRPPYGVTNPPLAKAVKKMNVTVVGWSIRSKDTVAKDMNRLFARIRIKIHGGGILLLHDSEKVTSEMLPLLISYLLKNNYIIKPIDELLQIKAYE